MQESSHGSCLAFALSTLPARCSLASRESPKVFLMLGWLGFRSLGRRTGDGLSAGSASGEQQRIPLP